MKERRIFVQNIEVNYKIAGKGPALFILHGWLSSSEKWIEFQNKLAQRGYLVVVPDLPGFGASSPPRTVWGVENYAEFLGEFAANLGIERFFLMGHSFGGQVAIRFAALHPERLRGLVLLAAAGVRRNLGLKENLLRSLAKPVNSLLSLVPSQGARDSLRGVLYRLAGKSDYARTKGIMKEVMAKVVREDLTPLFSEIESPTLIIWGKEDKVTPPHDALLMRKHIQNALLETLPGVGHRVREEAPEKLQSLVVKFLQQYV